MLPALGPMMRPCGYSKDGLTKTCLWILTKNRFGLAHKIGDGPIFRILIWATTNRPLSFIYMLSEGY